MKILIFNWRDLKHSWAGGGEIYVFEQASRWVKRGHIVTLFCGQDPEKKLPDYEEVQGIRIFRKGNRFTVYLWAVWYYLTKFRGTADIAIDVTNGIPFFTPLFVGIPKVCYVYHIHDNQFLYEIPFPLSYIGLFIERYLFPLLYKRIPLMVISQTTKNILVRYGFTAKNITIVYCGIHKTKKLSSLPDKFSTPTILYLGRIKRYKRVDLLVHIFPQILKKVPEARLIFAGWGTEASNIANLVMKSPFRRKMILSGPVTDAEKRKLLARSWVFVNPSIGEGWSIAVIEANLHGTPAISFSVPGLSESIKHGKTGLLATSINSFTEQICRVLMDKSLRDRLSSQSIKWASHFSWDKTAARSLFFLNKVYKSAR